MSTTPREFIVFDDWRRAYVSSIDLYDGDTDWCRDPRQARIFRGVEWAEFWTKLGRRLIPAELIGSSPIHDGASRP